MENNRNGKVRNFYFGQWFMLREAEPEDGELVLVYRMNGEIGLAHYAKAARSFAEERDDGNQAQSFVMYWTKKPGVARDIAGDLLAVLSDPGDDWDDRDEWDAELDAFEESENDLSGSGPADFD